MSDIQGVLDFEESKIKRIDDLEVQNKELVERVKDVLIGLHEWKSSEIADLMIERGFDDMLDLSGMIKKEMSKIVGVASASLARDMNKGTVHNINKGDVIRWASGRWIRYAGSRHTEELKKYKSGLQKRISNDSVKLAAADDAIRHDGVQEGGGG